MSNTLLISLVVLGVLGAVLSVILYFVAQKFKVEENPLIDEAEACLPGANCGGCGFAGCRALAEACVKQAAEKGNIDGLACPGTDMSDSPLPLSSPRLPWCVATEVAKIHLPRCITKALTSALSLAPFTLARAVAPKAAWVSAIA